MKDPTDRAPIVMAAPKQTGPMFQAREGFLLNNFAQPADTSKEGF